MKMILVVVEVSTIIGLTAKYHALAINDMDKSILSKA